jgi:predicted RNase H-like HicB family nuclease
MKKEQAKKDLSFYLSLDYPVTVHADPDGGFVAEIDDLPGCMTQADTPDELFAAIQDARRAWLEAAYETGLDIPLPRELDEYKGKILVRIPQSLHRDLAHAAKRDGVSLNQYITSVLAAGVHGDLLEARALALFAETTNRISRARWMTFAMFGTNEEQRPRGEIARLQRVELTAR